MAPAAKRSLKRLVAHVAGQSYNLPYRAVPKRHLVDMLVLGRSLVDILLSLITAIKTMKLAPNARILWRSGVCAVRRLSSINLAGCEMFAAAKCAGRSSSAARTTASRPVICRVIARMRMVNLVSSHAARRRKSAVMLILRILAMLRSRARKTSHARARYSSLAAARLRNRR